MKRSEKQCEDCIHNLNNQVGELKDIMILNALKCSRGQDTELNERCTLYAPIEGSTKKTLKPKLFAICVSLLLLALIADIGLCESPSPWTGNINFLIGKRYLEEEDWKPVDEQTLYGAFLDFRQKEWPVNIALGYSMSSADDSDIYFDPWLGPISARAEANIEELDIGVRKIFGEDCLVHVRPFIGGGVAMVWADFEVEALGMAASANDRGMGFWIDGGAYVTVGSVNVGFNVKWTKVTVELGGYETDAGGIQVGVLLGMHW